MINEASFASALLETFSLPIQACFERDPIPENRLTAGERAVFETLAAPEIGRAHV